MVTRAHKLADARAHVHKDTPRDWHTVTRTSDYAGI